MPCLGYRVDINIAAVSRHAPRHEKQPRSVPPRGQVVQAYPTRAAMATVARVGLREQLPGLRDRVPVFEGNAEVRDMLVLIRIELDRLAVQLHLGARGVADADLHGLRAAVALVRAGRQQAVWQVLAVRPRRGSP